MKLRLQSVDKQVVVITAATDGIGLATARLAARKGARLVLGFPDEAALYQVREEMRREGGEAIYVESDGLTEVDVRRIAGAAIERFGGFNTWINNAGTFKDGLTLETAVEDMQSVLNANLWSVIHGSRVACKHLRRKGGALINVSAEGAERAAPIYSATKQAVKGWSDALRMELERERAPVSVTLIKPAANGNGHNPDAVAEAILFAAATPVRDLFVGEGEKTARVVKRPYLAGAATLSAGLALTAFFRSRKSDAAKAPAK